MRTKNFSLACASSAAVRGIVIASAGALFFILAGPALAVEVDAPLPAAKPAARQPAFDIFEYAVDGNSLLSDLAIEQAVTPYLGERKTLRDIEGARAALEKRYRDAGYLTVIVSIPEQRVDGGTVALRVVEAGIDRLKVKGAEYTVPRDIKARVPELAEGHVPNFNKLQEQLTELNRSGDFKATPVLRAGKLPGTVEVQLDVEDQLPVHGSVEFSNRQTPNTTPDRLSASLRYDNLWQRRHSFGLTAQVAPERASDARVLAGTYVMPVGSSGGSGTFYGVHSRSQFAELSNAPGLGMLGNSDTLGTRYSISFGSPGDGPQTVSIGVDYKNVKQTLLVHGLVGSDTPISYAPVVANYSGTWLSHDDARQERSTTLDVTTTLGMRGLLGNSDEEFNAKRKGASASYFVLRTGLQHSEQFAHWTLFGKLDLQLPSGPLVPTEQFTLGGAESVRGYLEGERSGDGGVRGTVELRTPQFRPAGGASPWSLSGLAFFDTGRVVTRMPVAPQPDSQRLRGVGIGFRLAAPHALTLEVDAARALVDGDTTRAGDKRIHARTIWGF